MEYNVQLTGTKGLVTEQNRASFARRLPSKLPSKPSLHQRGETAIEFLMILTFGVLPMILAVWLLQDVIQEYVAFGQIFISSPFF